MQGGAQPVDLLVAARQLRAEADGRERHDRRREESEDLAVRVKRCSRGCAKLLGGGVEGARRLRGGVEWRGQGIVTGSCKMCVHVGFTICHAVCLPLSGEGVASSLIERCPLIQFLLEFIALVATFALVVSTGPPEPVVPLPGDWHRS